MDYGSSSASVMLTYIQSMNWRLPLGGERADDNKVKLPNISRSPSSIGPILQ